MATKKKRHAIRPHGTRRSRPAGRQGRRSAADRASKRAGPAEGRDWGRRQGVPGVPEAGLDFDVPTTLRLQELAWIAGLRLHWLACTPRRRRRALQLLRAAAGRKSIEPCLADIQRALAELYVSQFHAIQIIVTLYHLLAGPSEAGTLRRVASEIRIVLMSFEPIKRVRVLRRPNRRNTLTGKGRGFG